MSAADFAVKFAAAEITETGCRIWPGYTHRGYARYGGQGAYRVAYETFIGPIPPGMTVDHTCFNRQCVEPSHLRLLSHLANARNHRGGHGVVPDSECVNGHEWTVANTYVRPDGFRDCRTCTRERSRAYQLRRAAA